MQRAAKRGLPAITRILDATPPLLDVVYRAARDLGPTLELLSLYRREIASAFANTAAATNAFTTAPDGRSVHYLRTIIPINNEAGYGFARRHPTNRHNPYLAPGAQDDYLRGGLRAWDCPQPLQPRDPPGGPTRYGPTAVSGRRTLEVQGEDSVVPARGAGHALAESDGSVVELVMRWSSATRSSISSRVSRATRSVPNSSTL